MSFNQQQQSYYPNQQGQDADAGTSVAERAKFIERTYLHLGGAMAAFVALEFVFLNTAVMRQLGVSMLQTHWGLVLLLFVGVSWIADYFARHSSSRPMQYLGLGLYVLAEAVIFIPLLLLAQAYGGPDVIMTAGVSTLAIFAALTGIVMVTKKDFSWMRGALMILSLGALGLIAFSLIFGFQLGILFVVFMIALSACYILYDTSNIMRHYHPQAYVAAALTLFASVALMFWYILQFVMSLTSRD
ncbi:Bax inhibitor-1 family protein [Nannocystis sp.]|uniref:Bax inhibitor-1/YccA family protein n=1 Tax=Nannocystis sp. TaxID=1962667 RepID=UPI0025FAEB6D|nr:Bax inhibitor-1 family protein [Nannocystis sp.]